MHYVSLRCHAQLCQSPRIAKKSAPMVCPRSSIFNIQSSPTVDTRCVTAIVTFYLQVILFNLEFSTSRLLKKLADLPVLVSALAGMDL